MTFDVLLYTSLTIFLAGLLYKVWTWFSRTIGVNAENFTTAQRVSAAVKGIFATILSVKIFTLLKVLILDVILQIRILKESPLRWLMHMLIYCAFMLLLLMHAMEGIVSENLFTDYYSTVNPFMFLRDFLGFLVIAGVLIALYRRIIKKPLRLTSNGSDVYAIVIVAVIMVSGVFLEGMKISSYGEFTRMVDDYAGLDDETEIEALESYWSRDFGVVSPNVKAPFDDDVISMGIEVHEANCAECHSLPKWAPLGYGAAKIIKPASLVMDRAGMVHILWYIHILACFIGLAYLPFSKMFHIISTPLSLLINGIMGQSKKSDPANIATRQAIEIDACMHCTTCSQRCSAGPAFDTLENVNVLPSEKMTFLKSYIKNRDIDENGLKAIQEGIYLCTNCDRCTVVCPAGINLKELWMSVREELILKGGAVPLMLTPFSYFRGLNKEKFDSESYEKPLNNTKNASASKKELIKDTDKPALLTPLNRDFKETDALHSTTFSYCYACENCSTVCPVVGNYENPQKELGLLPHQIMRSAGLGLKELATGSEMLWLCLTCYQCQEHCPQGVNVTEILFDLKNIAAKEMV